MLNTSIKKIKAPIGDENKSQKCFLHWKKFHIKKIKAPIGDENAFTHHVYTFYSAIKKIKAPIGDEN